MKRNALLREAGREFKRNGFHKTSLEDIAKVLNVTKGALYHYVRNKHEILFISPALARPEKAPPERGQFIEYGKLLWGIIRIPGDNHIMPLYPAVRHQHCTCGPLRYCTPTSWITPVTSRTENSHVRLRTSVTN